MTRVLVTGGAGFIGSNLIRWILHNTSWDVVTIDRLDEAAALGRLARLKNTFRSRLNVLFHDLRASINPVNLPGPWDYVCHLAAASHVDRSVRDPIGFLQDNVIGTANLLEYCRQVTAGKILYFSTDEVFGPAPIGVSYDEHSAHNPNNPYAASKAAAEALIPAWASTYGLPLCVSHCTNIFGPNQYGEKFIPLVIGKIKRKELVQIHSDAQGNPSTRYYVHVDNVSDAIHTILTAGGIIGGPNSGKYNISGDEELSNLYVAQRIAELLGTPLKHELVDFVPSRPRHDMRYAIHGSKLRDLGWTITKEFETGLKELVST